MVARSKVFSSFSLFAVVFDLFIIFIIIIILFFWMYLPIHNYSSHHFIKLLLLFSLHIDTLPSRDVNAFFFLYSSPTFYFLLIDYITRQKNETNKASLEKQCHDTSFPLLYHGVLSEIRKYPHISVDVICIVPFLMWRVSDVFLFLFHH